ncbi:MAG TPA: efflux RND transporter periplasmic adaptor subunit [Arenimonas sp.]|nr:efflux RND transporter periplasmic adaptor subunit [Arenimonas sp.]HPO23748.1 efflux RND transporter periplasmic adaptor subunit [Arenimonas sp.]
MSSLPRVQSPARRRWLWPVVIVCVLAAAAYWFLGSRADKAEQGYRTDAVTRGEIRTAISATGTLSATATVDVGTQVSGILQSVDVDYNDAVKKDQVIARIDPSTYQARLDQANASLASARAGLNEAQASARNAEADYSRKADLAKRQLVSRTDADLALSVRDQARARIVSANAQVKQQQANVDSARLDLEKTVIRSPVDGVVLSRAVEPGQTVAASLQTPVLFKIAGDLRQMEIVLAIDEADIGQVRNGQSVKFSVDAFPDRNFRGKVKQIRLAATNTSNVITYPVVVEVENGDQTLLPGMTANAEIEISNRDNVLSIANAALRFKPTDAASQTATAGAGAQARNGVMISESLAKVADGLKLDANQRAAFDTAATAMRERADAMRKAAAARAEGQAAGSRTFGGPAGGGQRQGGNGNGGDGARRMAERMKQSFAPFRSMLSPAQQNTWDAELAVLATAKRAPVYKLVDGKPEQVTVRLGSSDGTRTEIMGEALAEGDLIIIGSARPTDSK